MDVERHYEGLHVGYRYWVIHAGRLHAPIAGGFAWETGRNDAHCKSGFCRKLDRISLDCRCGFYAWPHQEGKYYCSSKYFNPLTGRVDGNMDVHAVGAVVMDRPFINNSGMMRSRVAAVAALAMPVNVSARAQQIARNIAQRYEVDLVAPTELPTAAALYLDRIKSIEPFELAPRPTAVQRNLKEWLLKRRHGAAAV